VIVPDYQLSLAIGKEGQNARLAARLTGWRIDIRSDEAPAEPVVQAAAQPESARDTRPPVAPPAPPRVQPPVTPPEPSGATPAS
jgi:transcription termination/antitermination protein NusA